jgi:cyclophilin family peptidyl-prolyl cis-trans isomerase
VEKWLQESGRAAGRGVGSAALTATLLEITARLLECIEALKELDDAEGLQAAIRTARRLVDPEIGQALLPLTLHANHAVRSLAREVVTELELEIPAGEVAGVTNAAGVEDFAQASQIRGANLITTRGTVHIRFHSSDAPLTVLNFARLAERDYYDGLRFHRVVPGFVVQGGDPRGDGYGGPGSTIRCETSRHSYVRGAVGMALAGRDTGGSQFFITHSAHPQLDGRYTLFGEVTQGLAVVDALAEYDRILDVEIVRETGS